MTVAAQSSSPVPVTVNTAALLPPTMFSVMDGVPHATPEISDAACTVTAHSAVLSPAETVIVAVPASTAVTTPFFTVATRGLLLVQEISSSGAFAGESFAWSVSVSPGRICAVFWLSWMAVISMASSVTVTVHSAVSLPALAVIFALPSSTAVTRPSFTVATALLELLHSTSASVSSVPSASVTVAVSCRVSPGAISAVLWSSVISPTPPPCGSAMAMMRMTSAATTIPKTRPP